MLIRHGSLSSTPDVGYLHPPPLRGPSSLLAHRVCSSPQPPAIEVLYALLLHSSHQGKPTRSPVMVLSSKGASMG